MCCGVSRAKYQILSITQIEKYFLAWHILVYHTFLTLTPHLDTNENGAGHRSFGTGCAGPDVWDRICGTGCVGTDVWDRMCGTGCVGPDVWERMCGNGCNVMCNVMDTIFLAEHFDSKAIELTLFQWHTCMPADTTETVAEYSARLQPSINLHVSVTAFMFSCSGTQCTTQEGGSDEPCAVIKDL